MSVSLQKGQKVSLSKDNAGLSKVVVGLGWDEAPQTKRGFLHLSRSQLTVTRPQSCFGAEGFVPMKI